jgi:hypothetical protein
MYDIDFDNNIDLRNKHRLQNLLREMFLRFSVTIQQLTSQRASQIGFYRLLNNPYVSEDAIKSELVNRCLNSVNDVSVLCIHDTTEFNFFNHKNRIKSNTGLGPIDASKSGIGFKFHCSLVVDSKVDYVYGASNIELWNRETKPKEPYHLTRKKPIEEKESYKWIKGCDKSNEILKNAKRVIHIQDREGDIFEQLARLEDNKKIKCIIRSSHDRILENDERLWDVTASSELLGKYELEILADSHGKNNTKRTALMEVRIYKTKLKSPDKKHKDCPKATKELTLIETREIDPPKGCSPVLWRLITDLEVENFTDAFQVITWYSKRWMIEEFFKVIKKENLDVESSELEQGWALRKLAILATDTAIQFHQMNFNYEIEEGEYLESISSYSESEYECLEKINKTLEGKTEKQKNPFKNKTGKWVNWIFARIGGWKGYASQRKAGKTTLINGMKKFYTVFDGFMMNKDVCTR